MKTIRLILLGLLLLTTSSELQAQFYYTTNKSTITLDQYIGNSETVVISNFVTSIGARAFYDIGITSVTIPGSVTNIGADAFSSCSFLTNVAMTNGVISIGNDAFYECVRLTGVTIPTTVTSIGSQAFGFSYLNNITIPTGVTNIGTGAFYACKGIAAITVDTNNPDYMSNAGVLFNRDQTTLIELPPGDYVTNYTIPNGVTNISDDAFFFGSSLVNITIPDGLTTIGNWAFGYCSGLTNLVIPDSVTNIAVTAFGGCTSLTAIDVETNNSAYLSVGGILFNQDQTTLVTVPAGDYLTSYTIPDSVTTIGDYAFFQCVVTEMTIPGSVTRIGNEAFYECSKLTNITIPASVTSIGTGAFEGCYKLTSITIPNNITNMADYAFFGCSDLTNVLFTGDAPAADSTMFLSDNHVTVYYLPDTAGWAAFSTETGLTPVLWNPQIQTADANFGVQNNQFQFTVTGPTNAPIVLQTATDLGNNVWTTIQSCQITNGSVILADPAWSNYTNRFYRIVFP